MIAKWACLNTNTDNNKFPNKYENPNDSNKWNEQLMEGVVSVCNREHEIDGIFIANEIAVIYVETL